MATAIHFYEANPRDGGDPRVALYRVVFDPDVYPMDSWWHGRATAARDDERKAEDEPGSQA